MGPPRSGKRNDFHKCDCIIQLHVCIITWNRLNNAAHPDTHTKYINVPISGTCACQITQQKELCRCEGVKDPEMGDYPGGLDVIEEESL